MRLLPRDPEIGWLPYAWLVYLANLLIYPYFGSAAPWEWGWTAAAVAAFLPLYFVGYWVHGTRLLMVISAITALGAALGVINPGASVFFVFAACFVGRLGEPAQAARYLAAILAVIAAESLWLRLPIQFWLPGLFFSLLMGAVCIHYSQRRRVNRRLSLAHQEVEHLAKVAERERISRDLHDLLGHTLSVIILKAELASKLADRDVARAIAEIRDVERISREALTQVREAVRGYRTAGLGPEIAQARATLETAGIQVAAPETSPPLPPVHEGVLVMALREAVTNVLRHSQATTCRLEVSADERRCELLVADNGRGSDGREGCGLSGMRERVTALGGTLECDGSLGTTLRVRLPLNGAQA